MKTTEKIEAFTKLSKKEKIQTLQENLQIFENAKNVLHDVYLLVNSEANVLTDDLLNDIYKILLELIDGVKNKSLGEKIGALEGLQKKILQIKKEEESEIEKELAEGEALLAQL